MQTRSLIFPTQSINYMFIPLMKNSLKLQLLVMMWEWCRDRDRGGRDYYSPSCSRSISWSESPCDDKHYRPNHNSKGPRQNDQSPRSKRNCGSDKRTFSPMRNDQSLRSPSPRENDRHEHDKKNQGSDQQSPSPRRYERSLSRSFFVVPILTVFADDGVGLTSIGCWLVWEGCNIQELELIEEWRDSFDEYIILYV